MKLQANIVKVETVENGNISVEKYLANIAIFRRLLMINSAKSSVGVVRS